MVRGAYMSFEKENAIKKNIENPVNESYEATSEMIHGNIENLIKNVISQS